MSQSITVYSSSSVYEMLDLIRKKPEVWLSEKSILALQNFLNGYLARTYTDGDPPFGDFDLWLLGAAKHPEDWGRAGRRHFLEPLLKEVNGDQYLAFDRFFVYLDEYRGTGQTHARGNG